MIPTVRLGAHMSIAGGMWRAVERANQVRATALQVFVKNSNRWDARALEPEQVRKFRDAVESAGLAPYTLCHTSYLINLGSPDRALWERSVAALRSEADRCTTLGIPYLVLHPGAHVGSGEHRALRRIARGIDLALGYRKGRPGGTARRAGLTVLLENSAGQGTTLGHRFEQIAQVIELTSCADRLGVCFDTCHALAAGYELRDPRSFRRTFSAFDRTIGLDRLKAFHLNDSKRELGSRVDRHEHIGRGALGREPFRWILNDARFRDLPMVLETPKGEDLAEDRRNLRILRRMVRPQGETRNARS